MSSRVDPRALGLGTADEAFRGPKGGPQWNIAECVAIRALGLKVIHHIVPILARSNFGSRSRLYGDAVGNR
jgi:hypothetical protein